MLARAFFAGALLLLLPAAGWGAATARPAPGDGAPDATKAATDRPAAPPTAAAASKDGDESAAEETTGRKAARRRTEAERPGKVIALEGDEIVGKVPKPQVFYVLGRTPIRYRGVDVRRSFVHKIVESLKRNPL